MLRLTVAFVKVRIVTGRSRTSKSKPSHNVNRRSADRYALYNAQNIWAATVLCCNLEKSFSKGSVVARFLV